MSATTKEFYKSIKNNRYSKQMRKTHGYPYRDYSWYIYRILNKFDFIKNEDKFKIFNKVKKNYRLLIKTLSNGHIPLIKTLCWKTMTLWYPNKKFRYKDFDITSTSINNIKKDMRKVGVNI